MEKFKKINSATPLSQKEMVERFYDFIVKNGKKFKKTQLTYIREGVVGEEVITLVESGPETKKIVEADQFVVQAITNAKEEYVITKDKFLKRYEYLKEAPEELQKLGFKIYTPKGKIIAVKGSEISEVDDIHFEAPWKELMKMQIQDWIAIPVGFAPEVYRIALSEFNQTYSEDI